VAIEPGGWLHDATRREEKDSEEKGDGTARNNYKSRK
jgi:hypothetical protein